MQLVLDELATNNVNFFALQIDASNVKNRKYFVICVQYFNEKVGIVNKIINFEENADESANGMAMLIEKTLSELKLDFTRVSCLSADNCNANYGNKKSLFTELQLKNCHAHIMHNTVKFAIDYLNYDVENLVLKLYSHFSQSAKRRESFKDMSEFVCADFLELLHYVSTRWISLNPCITRMLKCWKALLSYFRSLGDCPQQIQKLLYINDNEYEDTPDTEIPEINLLFCNHLLQLFEEAVLILESNKTTVIDVYNIFTDLLEKLENRKQKQFFGALVKDKLKHLDPSKAESLRKNFLLVIDKSIAYLNRWFNFEKENWYYHVSSLSLRKPPEYEVIERVMELIPQRNKDILLIDLNMLFDEVATLSKFFELSNLSSTSGLTTTDKWVLVFKENDLPNMLKLMGYVLSMPASTAFVERIFSIMNLKWTDIRNKCSAELIKSELLITVNFNFNCKDFYKSIISDKKLLLAVMSNEKYRI